MTQFSSGDPRIDRRFAYAEAAAADGDHAAAAELLADMTAERPDWAPAWLALARARLTLADLPGARFAYAEAAARDHDGRLGAALEWAALAEGPPQHAMPAAFVAALFDDYAPRFDRHLRETLAYRGPEAIAEALAAADSGTAPSRRFRRAIDLGCGTGLLPASLSGRVDHWIGADLSAGMLRKARRRNIYARLAEAEATEFLATEPPQSADLVAAADLLPYLGAIDTLFAAVARVLEPGGLFIATAEEIAEDAAGHGFSLRESRRFAHSRTYLGHCLAATGLTVRDISDTSIRTDRGSPVKSLILLAEKAAN